MNIQYNFSLALKSLTLRKELPTDSLFRVTLIETNKQIDPGSLCFQTEQKKIDKNKKQLVLEDEVRPFKFGATADDEPGSFLLKYEIRGQMESQVQSIPLNLKKLFVEYKKKQKTTFKEQFRGDASVLGYQISIEQNDEKRIEEVAALQTEDYKSEEKNSSKPSLKENASKGGRGRMSRPPELNLLKKAEQKARAISLQPESKSQEVKELHTPQMMNKSSTDELPSENALRKKATSVPLEQIQKVNELLATHHRSEQSQSQIKQKGVSYKLKVVLLMMAIGILMLLYDTIGDRSKRRAQIAKFQKQKKHKDRLKQSKGRQRVRTSN